jgi:glycosyltransferase involved in cell wall biosynthesis
MRIVLYHHERLPVPKYGGTERIVVWLSQGLVELGHEVTLLAGKGSRVPGVRVVEVEATDVHSPSFDLRRYVPEAVDLIHYHTPVAHPPALPWLWTLHGNMKAGLSIDPHGVCVSADHARRHGTRAYVLNGVRLDEYEFRSDKDDYDLFLARLHSVKGWHIAVEVAKELRVRLVVAGGWRPNLSRYVKFVGEIGGEKKQALLAGARCLWAPVQWDDPCPVNLLEALASGTPVIGSHRGALPEVITPAVGGLGDTFEEWVALRKRLREWAPSACRRRAERCFDHLRMTRDYLRMYQHLLEHGSLPEGRPVD